jgi:PLP dependent protein
MCGKVRNLSGASLKKWSRMIIFIFSQSIMNSGISPLFTDEIAANLEIVRDKTSTTCARVGRDVKCVEIVAVTKMHPPGVISKAYALGLRHLGENRVQEALGKFSNINLNGVLPGAVLHLVGHVQSNKVRKAVTLFHSIDSVDSVDLAREIAREAEKLNRKLRVLIEINTSGEAQKFGISPDNARRLAEDILNLQSSSIDVAGFMTVGPNVEDESTIRRSFADLRALFDDVKEKLNPPHWSALSMGMSGDYEIAIEEGATEIRLGTALFGPRRML